MCGAGRPGEKDDGCSGRDGIRDPAVYRKPLPERIAKSTRPLVPPEVPVKKHALLISVDIRCLAAWRHRYAVQHRELGV